MFLSTCTYLLSDLPLKAELTLCLIKHHTLKTYGRWR